MQRTGAFEVEGIIVDILPNKTFRAELANGHRLLAFVTGRAKQTFAPAMGQKVMLQVSAYDLSQGRILPG
ncbi:MAG TPA: translation initiation factor IF-1 [Candidatus Dormibacteraeota bacterium]|nr:translation initiation factor IF-1 [Candidatus Dormibacteraeota bacterium]